MRREPCGGESGRLANKNQGRLANVFWGRFDTYFYARCSAPSDSFSRLSFPPDSDLVAGGICGHVVLGSVLHVHIALRQPTRGLRLYRSGLKLGCQRKQWQRQGSEGCCSGELSEGQHIRYPLCDGSTKFG